MRQCRRTHNVGLSNVVVADLMDECPGMSFIIFYIYFINNIFLSTFILLKSIFNLGWWVDWIIKTTIHVSLGVFQGQNRIHIVCIGTPVIVSLLLLLLGILKAETFGQSILYL